VKSLPPLKQVAPPPDVFGKVALANTFLIPAYKSVSQLYLLSPFCCAFDFYID